MSTTHETSTPIRVDKNEEHLKLLAQYHWVVSGLYLVTLILTVIIPLWFPKLVTKTSPTGSSGQLLLIRLVVQSVFVVITGLNAWYIKRHKQWLGCCILSVYECCSIVLLHDPIGLILGLSSVIKLRSESVRELFYQAKQSSNQPR